MIPSFIKRFNGQPLSVAGLAIAITTVTVVGYRGFIQPRLNKKQREEAQQYADFLFEKEQRSKHR